MDKSKKSKQADEKSAGLARLLISLGCSAVGLLPLLLGYGDPLIWVAWIAVISFPTGVFSAASGQKAWPWGFAAPGIWMSVLVCLEARAEGVLPEPAWAAVAWTGLFALGMTLGAIIGREPWRLATLSFCLSAALAVLPVSGAPWMGLWGGQSLGQLSPTVAARLFGLSPVTLILESAGLDWMRHRAVYSAAGTEWFSDRRQPFRGNLAAPSLLLLGCVGIFLSRSRQRAIGVAQNRSASEPNERH